MGFTFSVAAGCPGWLFLFSKQSVRTVFKVQRFTSCLLQSLIPQPVSLCTNCCWFSVNKLENENLLQKSSVQFSLFKCHQIPAPLVSSPFTKRFSSLSHPFQLILFIKQYIKFSSLFESVNNFLRKPSRLQWVVDFTAIPQTEKNM